MSKERARKIKLLIFDVDGVMTDGTLWFVPGPSGGPMVESKGFNAHDGAGFSLAKLGGLKTGIITRRSSETVAQRARDLKIEFVYQGSQDKLTALAEILKKEGFRAEEVCYVGDDVIDLPVMRVCGLAVAVRNAREVVKDEADFITDHEGGDGAVRDVIEYVLKAQDKLDNCIERYIASQVPDSTFGQIEPRKPKRS
jgi:3-deoxy-D-manno-octulosonate 8-phosphate phosphatase (KDO 8-P phosphatase)